MNNEQNKNITSKLSERERAFRENFAYRVYVSEIVYAKVYTRSDSSAVHHNREEICNYHIVSTDLTEVEGSNVLNQCWKQDWYGIKKWLDDGFYILYLDNDYYDVRQEDKALFDSLTDDQKILIAERFYGYIVDDSTVPVKEILHGQSKY